MWNYQIHVHHFSSRELIYKSDALNAFTAILEDLGASLDTTFCWGLPCRYFSHTFLWRACYAREEDYLNLRRRPDNGSRAAFPSWPWAGWAGQFAFLVAPPADHAKYMITWPWDPGFDIETSEDLFQTGVLHIRVGISSANLEVNLTLEFPHNMYRNDFGHFTYLGSTQYNLVCTADKSDQGLEWPDTIMTHIVLALHRSYDWDKKISMNISQILGIIANNQCGCTNDFRNLKGTTSDPLQCLAPKPKSTHPQNSPNWLSNSPKHSWTRASTSQTPSYTESRGTRYELGVHVPECLRG